MHVLYLHPATYARLRGLYRGRLEQQGSGSGSLFRRFACDVGSWNMVAGEAAQSTLGIVGHPLPVDHDAGFVADDPSIVTRCSCHEVSGPDLSCLTIVHDNLH